MLPLKNVLLILENSSQQYVIDYGFHHAKLFSMLNSLNETIKQIK